MIVKKDANAAADDKGKNRYVLVKAESDSDAEGHLLEPDVEKPEKPVGEVVLPGDPLAPKPKAPEAPTPVTKYIVCQAGCAKCNKDKFCLVPCEEGFRTVKKSRGNKCFPCNSRTCPPPSTGKDYTLRLYIAKAKHAGTKSKILIRFMIFGKWTYWM